MTGPRVWTLVGARTMRALDHHTIETLGVPGELLMESAGRAAAELVLEELPAGGEVLVVCGMGNNGGDGFVVARHLHVLGVPVRLALLGDPRQLRADAATNARRAHAAGLEIGGPRWRTPRSGVIVDAIFGTGLTRAVDKTPAASVRRPKASTRPPMRVSFSPAGTSIGGEPSALAITTSPAAAASERAGFLAQEKKLAFFRVFFEKT